MTIQRTVLAKAFGFSRNELKAKRDSLKAQGIPCGSIRTLAVGFTFLHWHSGPKVNLK